MKLAFKPITQNTLEMSQWLNHGLTKAVCEIYQSMYDKQGFQFPWIGYFVFDKKQLIGVGGFKGIAKNNRIEIAYGVIPEKEGQSYASHICKQLINIALKEDTTVIITARTLTQENTSTHILIKNNFELKQVVIDEEDGEVWEWHYVK